VIAVKTKQTLEKLQEKNCVVALGCFDGVHIGHIKLIQYARRVAEEKGYKLAVYSFAEPPKNFFDPFSVPVLTPIEEKKRIMASLKVDLFVCTPFDEKIAYLSPDQFFSDILIHKFGARHIICGFNYRFGKNGEGDVALLEGLCQSHGIEFTVMPAVNVDGKPASSSEIRKLLGEGDVKKASSLLTRPYSIKSTVVNGQHLGRQLGFPTINQTFDRASEILPHGVYATKVRIGQKSFRSITNIGTRPTVDGNTLCAETHIFDFSGDLYGSSVRVEFMQFIRPETKFSSIDALKAQVALDIEKVKGLS
jgi:riboflavin kinase/FMN adenylyltransferase